MKETKMDIFKDYLVIALMFPFLVVVYTICFVVDSFGGNVKKLGEPQGCNDPVCELQKNEERPLSNIERARENLGMLEELFDPETAEILKLADLVQETTKNPSDLNYNKVMEETHKLLKTLNPRNNEEEKLLEDVYFFVKTAKRLFEAEKLNPNANWEN